MALLDSYATAAEYLTGTGNKATADALMLTQLTGMSRLLEKSLQVMAGAWNTHTGTYVFTAPGGGSRLRLRDEDGRQYFLQAIATDGLGVDSDRDGLYDDYTLDFADAWVRGLPANAAAHSEPYRSIELRALDGATITSFPSSPGAIEIEGTWGWATVPDSIKRLVIHRTHELRQAMPTGAAEQLPSFDAGDAPMAPNVFWLWKEAERRYGRRLPGFA
ncbi:MAG: hypothetical protein AB7G21_08575 [Dehalococcoidia bacterium]